MHGGKVLFGLPGHQLIGAIAMSEETTTADTETEAAALAETKANEAAKIAAEQAKLGQKIPHYCGRRNPSHQAPKHLCIPQPLRTRTLGFGHSRHV